MEDGAVTTGQPDLACRARSSSARPTTAAAAAQEDGARRHTSPPAPIFDPIASAGPGPRRPPLARHDSCADLPSLPDADPATPTPDPTSQLVAPTGSPGAACCPPRSLDSRRIASSPVGRRRRRAAVVRRPLVPVCSLLLCPLASWRRLSKPETLPPSTEKAIEVLMSAPVQCRNDTQAITLTKQLDEKMLLLEEEHWRTGLVMRGDAARGSDNSRRRREQASGGGAVATVDKAAGIVLFVCTVNYKGEYGHGRSYARGSYTYITFLPV
uniref:Uncharacterized protein n=1 Tax=Leersia perrieri TaxID=77586 RepID=A0A0D9W7L6_9ORYZ